jgi:hypothetical protein
LQLFNVDFKNNELIDDLKEQEGKELLLLFREKSLSHKRKIRLWNISERANQQETAILIRKQTGIFLFAFVCLVGSLSL